MSQQPLINRLKSMEHALEFLATTATICRVDIDVATAALAEVRDLIKEVEGWEPVAISEGDELYWIANKKPAHDYEEDHYLYNALGEKQ